MTRKIKVVYAPLYSFLRYKGLKYKTLTWPFQVTLAQILWCYPSAHACLPVIRQQ